MNQPRVSILIPVYNRENFIAPCIESALSQTFSDLEVIVVDNASTDRTWDICMHFAGIDSRVRVFRNDENIGPVRNWLACVAEARGEYTKILWSDDLIHPEFLSKLLPYLENPDVGFVYSSVDIFEKVAEDARARLYTSIGSGVYDSSKYIEGSFLDFGDLPCSPGCAVFRTADVVKNMMLHVPNRVNSDFSMHAIGNDLLLFLLTAQQYPKFAVVNEPMAYFRAHRDSISISAPSGKIPLHYDLAKGFFAENFVSEPAMLRKINTYFFIHLLRFKPHKFGIASLDDFYPTLENNRIDWSFLISKVFPKFGRKLLKRPTFDESIIE
ncbi:MAG: glycosyltransferase [Gammaproteobacteria bacterium]|nr:glycosyltransferase [Gammaproteobacteria bacterium]MBU1406934.1 glycosyltransferase [Gammaproteobacteria bacterium]MBU1533077.1 glycosyltransferase [Gammaproteobacteria bacterium]